MIIINLLTCEPKLFINPYVSSTEGSPTATWHILFRKCSWLILLAYSGQRPFENKIKILSSFPRLLWYFKAEMWAKRLIGSQQNPHMKWMSQLMSWTLQYGKVIKDYWGPSAKSNLTWVFAPSTAQNANLHVHQRWVIFTYLTYFFAYDQLPCKRVEFVNKLLSLNFARSQ